MFLGRTADAGIPRVFLEDNALNVIRSLESGNEISFQFIDTTEPDTVLRPVRLVSGPRRGGRPTEVVEIEANGEVIAGIEIVIPEQRGGPPNPPGPPDP